MSAETKLAIITESSLVRLRLDILLTTSGCRAEK
jgi:hypothetical protein